MMKNIAEITEWLEQNNSLQRWGVDLLNELGTYSPDAIARLKAIELAALLETKVSVKAASGDPWGEEVTARIGKVSLLQAATEILRQLHAMGFTTQTPAHTVQAPEPKEFTVKLDQPIESRSLKDKFFYAMEHPEEAWELLGLIERDPIYVAAANKVTATFGYPLCIVFVGGSITVDGTIGYLNWVSREYSTPQMEWEGCELGTLRQALKIEEKLRVHPLLNEVVSGPDKVGQNYLPLDEKDPELWDAIVWARMTKNPLFPTEVDLYEMGTEILAHVSIPLPLDSRWERIRKAFRSARNGGNAKDGIRLDINSVKKKDILNFSEKTPSSSRCSTEADFKKLVYQNIDQIPPSRKYQGSGSDIKGIFRRLVVQGSGCDLNSIVLESGSIQGSGIDGTIKIPEWKAQPSIQGSGCDVDIKKVSWEYVARQMGLL